MSILKISNFSASHARIVNGFDGFEDDDEFDDEDVREEDMKEEEDNEEETDGRRLGIIRERIMDALWTSCWKR